MSVVYVVQESPNRDLGAAAKFGDLKLLLPAGDIVLSPGPTIRRLREGLRSFSNHDYLLLMGDPVAIGLATSIAAEFNLGRVRFLKWSRRGAVYFPIEADLQLRPAEVCV
ncbi:MAG: hypothetical protein E6Q97_26595 [Desulfurellales bacterium]|nr:MAG: hypothetical protein E6Q97_26595 [Desulfurellales bacterium]